ncbi:MAG: DsbA family oxidoreductase [Rhizobiaceae bacterium]
MPAVTIDVVSDVVCPWCFLGQKRLAEAISQAGGIDVDVRWRPFQLDPSIPPGGVDRKAYMEAKFGSGDKVKAAHDRLLGLGGPAGINFAFGDIKIAPNTLDAHRVIRWAYGAGGGSVQGAVVAALFKAFFEDGRDLGDHLVLIDTAESAGMDRALVTALLASDADIDTVTEEIRAAQNMGITGVPFFLLDGKYAVPGAQETEVLAGAIAQVAKLKAESAA